MAFFPKIQSPCPYLDRLGEVIEDGLCRMCRRDVHDLTVMDDRERLEFLATCGGDACVSYTMAVKPAVAAALIAASAAALAVPGAALAASNQAGQSHDRQKPVETQPVDVQPVDEQDVVIVTAGGLGGHRIDRASDPAPHPPAPPQKPD